MQLPDGVFRTHGQPCDEARVQEIERNLGVQLPESYREFIKSTGGGTVSNAYTCSRRYYDSPATSHDCIIMIYGNGPHPQRVYGFDLDRHATSIAKEWQYPTWGIFIGEGSGTVHTPLLMNVSNPAYPVGSIIFLDLELDEETLIYEDFQKLLDDLADPYLPAELEG